MKFKKALAVILVLSIIATLIGCSNNNDVSNSNNAPSANNQTDNNQTGKKTHKLKVLTPESGNPHIKFAEREKYLPWKELQKIFDEKGLDFEYEIIADDQYETTIQTRMAASKDIPDFVNIDQLDIATKLNLIDAGMFLPINKIIDEYSSEDTKKFFTDGNKGAFARKSSTSPDGNRYWITSMQETTYDGKPASTCQIVNIRKDWLEKVNMEAPKNAEEFITVLKAFQDKDANGNGAKDEVFGTTAEEFANGVSQWFGLPGNNISLNTKTGKVTSPWLEPGIKDYFNYIKRLIKEGLMDQTLIGAKPSVLDQKVAENKISALYTYAMAMWFEPSIVGVSDAAYLPIGPLQAAEGITPVNLIEPPQLAWQAWAFTKFCKDQEGAAKLIDIICSDKYADLSAWGVEGKTFEIKDGMKSFIIKRGDWEEMARSGNTAGDFLWRNTFPKVRFVPMESEINSVTEHKAKYQKDVIFYEPTFPDNPNPYFAVPTIEEQEKLNEIERDFRTFSKELATDLMLGNRSVDDWDKHMKDLEDVGLKEIIKIYQARSDRFMKS